MATGTRASHVAGPSPGAACFCRVQVHVDLVGAGLHSQYFYMWELELPMASVACTLEGGAGSASLRT